MRTTDRNPQRRLANLFRSRSGLVYLVGLALLMFLVGYLAAPGPSEQDSTESAHDHAGAPTIWTCSMHPQIKLPEAGKCPICFMDLIPLVSGNEEMGERQLRMTDAAVKLASISTSEVIRAAATKEINLSGKVAYDESRLTHLAAWMPGRIEKMYADFTGERVVEGDPLVEIYSPQLISAQQELLEAARVLNRPQGRPNETLRVSAETTLKATREKLRLLGLTSDQIDQIETSDSVSETLTVYSSVAGTIIQKSVSEGMYVQAGSRLYSIADLSHVWIMLDVSESDLSWVKLGSSVEFGSAAMPGETFVGKVTFIDPVLNDATRSVSVRVEADNRDSRLKPNMFVKALLLPTAAAEKSMAHASGGTHAGLMPLLIPATAPLLTGTRAIVYVQLHADSGYVFEGREIELGPRAGYFYIVKSGLSEGDRVVTHGAFKIDAELQLQGRVSMMNPDGGSSPALHDHGSTVPTESSQQHQMGESSMQEPVSVSSDALERLQIVYEAYFEVQRDLAADDAVAAFKAAELLQTAIADFDLTGLDEAARDQWTSFRDKSSEHIAKFSANDISAQRVVFEPLSDAVIGLHDSFGHSGGGAFYLTFCPMAFDNKGAYWMQDTNVVFNSFYGAAMLRCGSIKQEYQPATGAEK